jgi:hypothetical protein
MKKVKLFEEFLNEEVNFPAQFEIGEPVSFITAPGDDERWGTIVKVSFTKAKVWYDILDDYTAQVIEDVDSSFVKTLKSDIKLEEPTNESRISSSDQKKLYAFAEQVSEEIIDANPKADEDEFSPDAMIEYFMDQIEMNDYSVKEFINDWNWRENTMELGL